MQAYSSPKQYVQFRQLVTVAKIKWCWLVHLATILVPVCVYCFNLNKFDQLTLWKTIKSVTTRCHILRLKCTKFDFSWGSAPDHAGGAYSAPPDLLVGFKGSYFYLLLREGN